MTMLLPIPAKKQQVIFYFIPYDLAKDGYTNFKGQIEIRGSETVMDMRNEILKKYGVAKASYTVTKVNNNDFQRYFSTTTQVDETQKDSDGKYLLIYEANPTLNPEFPEIIDSKDSNNGISEHYTRIIVNTFVYTKSQYS